MMEVGLPSILTWTLLGAPETRSARPAVARVLPLRARLPIRPVERCKFRSQDRASISTWQLIPHRHWHPSDLTGRYAPPLFERVAFQIERRPAEETAGTTPVPVRNNLVGQEGGSNLRAKPAALDRPNRNTLADRKRGAAAGRALRVLGASTRVQVEIERRPLLHDSLSSCLPVNLCLDDVTIE
jgi:hypothetical protein